MDKVSKNFSSKVIHLKNGLKIWYLPNRKSKLVNVGFWTLGGMAMETKETLEYYHFLEHMVADFTSEKYPNGSQNNKSLKSIGVDLQGQVEDLTMHIWMEGHSRASDVMIDMLVNTLLHYKMDPKRFEQERESIVTELQGHKNDPFHVLEEFREKILYPNHALSATLNDRIRNTKKATIKKLSNFFKKAVLTGRTIVYVSGYLENPDKSLKLLKTKLSKMKKSKPLVSLNEYKNYKPSPISNKNMKRITLKESYTSRIQLIWKVPLTEFNDNTKYLYAFESILKTRLFDLLRIQLGLIYNVTVESTFDILNENLSTYIIELEVSTKNNIQPTINATLDFIDKMDISENDLRQAKLEETNDYEGNKLNCNLDKYFDYISYLLTNRKIVSFRKKHINFQSLKLKKLKEILRKLIPTQNVFIFVGLTK